MRRTLESQALNIQQWDCGVVDMVVNTWNMKHNTMYNFLLPSILCCLPIVSSLFCTSHNCSTNTLYVCLHFPLPSYLDRAEISTVLLYSSNWDTLASRHCTSASVSILLRLVLHIHNLSVVISGSIWLMSPERLSRHTTSVNIGSFSCDISSPRIFILHSLILGNDVITPSMTNEEALCNSSTDTVCFPFHVDLIRSLIGIVSC